jgi:membrane protein YdbS with pleckstrin-like domain
MSDKYLKNLLGDNEQVLFATHQHWLVLAGEILSETVLTVAVIVGVTLIYFLWLLNPLVFFGYLLLIFPLVSLLRDVLNWSNRKYVVTSRRVIQLAGVFNKNVTDSSLEKVNDVKLSQSFLGRMFDYGDIEILTASELGVNKFTHIGHPIQYKTAMINAKEKLERAPEPVARPVAPPSAPTVSDLLAQLNALRQNGVLTEDEFLAKKTELLKKM